MANCLRNKIKPFSEEESRGFQILSRQELDKDEILKRFELLTVKRMGTLNIDFSGFENPGINPTVVN